MSSPESSLPEAWVRRIWDTMRATYGAAFDRQWECPAGVTPQAHVQTLMETWGRGLAQLQQNPSAIAYGLDNLPADHPPNLLQFRALCNRRPGPSRSDREEAEKQKALPSPKPDPKRVQQVLAGITRPSEHKDPLAWAKRLQRLDTENRGRMEDGRPITLAQRQTYRVALGLDRMEQFA